MRFITPCINKWAVRTGEVNGQVKYFGQFIPQTVSMFSFYSTKNSIDSAKTADLGEEFQFDDSIKAINTYNVFDQQTQRFDSLNLIMLQNEKRKSDSIFKCQHSYK